MNALRTGPLLAALTTLILLAGLAIGGETGLAIAPLPSIAMNAFAYWNSDKLVLCACPGRASRSGAVAGAGPC